MRVFFNGMENKESKPKGRGGKTYPSKQDIYVKIALRSDEILNVLFDKLKSKNEAIALGAAKTLTDRIVPALKSQELKGEHGQLFPITILTGINPTRKGFIPPSKGSITNGQPQVQGISVAQKGKKDIHSDKRDSKTSAP